MRIKLITKEGESEITKDNFVESMQRLENMLKPGTPVMFQNFSWNDHPWGAKYIDRILLYSGGKLSSEGIFNIQKGKRNYVYATISKDDPNSYRFVHQGDELLYNNGLVTPKTWTSRESNEGTFSSAGTVEWTSFHKAGTTQLVIGDILNEQFPNALNELNYVRDAIYFNLDGFYSVQNYLITEIGDIGPRGEKEQQRTDQTHRIACVRACVNLLGEVKREVEQINNPLIVNQTGWYRDGAEPLRKMGLPIDNQDYIVKELQYPGKIVAFIKVGKGIAFGETYILPHREEVEAMVERAFSEEIVARYYPHGLKRT
jgi:hypothetical protein